MIERCVLLPKDLPKNVVTSRIEALYNAYCDSVGVDIFTQTVDGQVTAVFGGMDGSYSLFVFDNADFDELDSYFSFLGATIFCLCDTAERLKGEKIYSDLYELTAEAEVLSADGHGRVADVYGELQKGQDGDIVLPPFPFWYTDFCVRFNHGAAEYAVCDGAVAVAGFVTEDVALVTGVATDPAFRKCGKGSYALKLLLSNIKKKYPKCRVFAATKNAAGFYIKNRFLKVGTVAVLDFRSF